jgi:hypothetical protein
MKHHSGKWTQGEQVFVSVHRRPLQQRHPPRRRFRDECRGNTTTTRKTLIEIARKKQDRSMITAWNQYKDKLAKAAAGRATLEKRG